MATHKVSSARRRQMIAEAAYFRAERRGFGGGDPLLDWTEAEAEVDAALRRMEMEYVLERLELGFATATKQLAALKKKVSSVAAEARTEWQRDVEKLGKLRETLRKKLDEARDQGEEAGQKAKQQAEKIWDEMTAIAERVGAKVSH